MSDHIRKTIADLQEKVRKQEDEVLCTKRMVNALCEHSGIPPIYGDAELQRQGPSVGVMRSDLFYGRPLATCVREFLEMRKAANQGAAPIEEIISALGAGGYDLPSISADKDGQKRGVAISLAKNNTMFHRLPNGDWGLTSWYPNIRERKTKPEEASNGRIEGNKGEIVIPNAEAGAESKPRE